MARSIPSQHHSARLSPLARGAVDRLLWAVGLSVALWLAVWWALA